MAGAATTDAPDENEAKRKSEKVRKWRNELDQAKKRFSDFHDQAEKAVKRYLDDNETASPEIFLAPRRLSLFHSNVDVLRSNLFGQIPKAEADRRFFDPSDDTARVAAEMVTRIINNDFNNPQAQDNEVLKAALQDKLIAGLGMVRFRYTMTEIDDPAVTPESLATQYPTGVPKDYAVPKVKGEEGCEPVYTYWKDTLWGPCRTWGPDWVAFRAFMTEEEVSLRFTPEIAALVPYGTVNDSGSATRTSSDFDDNKRVQPEAEIWEIWDRTGKETLWMAKGFERFCDEKDDILELPGFFPTPRPLIANVTSSKFIPKPNYEINRGLYEEIDELETRKGYLTRACKAVGLYDQANKDIERMMNEGVENQLIPSNNWAMFVEKGGMKGSVDWMPIDAFANALKICSEEQNNRIQQLYQVEGISDIMRGQASAPGTTAAEQKIKAQFASVRLQFMQEEFAEYVSDCSNIKVAIIRSLYDEAKIIKLSNADAFPEPDKLLVPEAVKLIKDTKAFNIRIVVKAESLIQKNMEAIKGERTELLQGIAQFIGMAQQMIAENPEAAPFVFQLLQFGISAFDGASEMEGLFDAWIEKMEEKLAKAAANPQPPPEVQAEQAKAQSAIQIEQAKAQGAAQLEQVKGQTAAQVAQAEGATQVATKQAEGQVEIQVEAKRAEIELEKERLRLAAEAQVAEADRQLEREKLAAENQRAADKLASDERIAAADRLSKELLEREKIQSQERQAEKAAEATVKAAKEKPAGASSNAP